MGTKVLIEMKQQLRHVVASSENAPTSTKQLEDLMDVNNSIFLVFEDITYTARPWILSGIPSIIRGKNSQLGQTIPKSFRSNTREIRRYCRVKVWITHINKITRLHEVYMQLTLEISHHDRENEVHDIFLVQCALIV
ncbi:unnamed protein product [Heterotrigona itama]|uniref:BRCT domain-containing protein n=1 Tax=Heterotrigona itama TaxID=395501 RepID=A0A6V7H657_9HYME|nr:unnamed protein product [Heterotrigona itama]